MHSRETLCYFSVLACITVLTTEMVLTFFILLSLAAPSAALDHRGFISVTGAADLRTTFSDGADSVFELTQRAKELGLDSIIINDHLVFEIEYGIFPFEHLFKYRKVLSSIKTNGVREYLEEINKVQKEIPEVIIIPGLEVSPIYWWSGSLFNRSLMMNHWENHLGIMGVEDPEIINNIPVVHNQFTSPPDKKKYIRIIILSLALLLSFAYKIFYSNNKLWGFIVVVNLLLVINYFPTAGPDINIYSKPSGTEPYQKVIDYVNEQGGISVWHHMEAITGMGKKGFLHINTPKHPDDLLKTDGVTGFQGNYPENITIIDPGKQWDQALMEYVMGKRQVPPWSFGGLDYHSNDPKGPFLKNVKHIYWVKEKSKEEILESMRVGRFYTIFQDDDEYLVLDQFSVSGSGSSKEAVSGETIEIKGKPTVKIRIDTSDGKIKTGKLLIIHDNKTVVSEKFSTPFKRVLTLAPGKNNRLSYVRLMVKGRGFNLQSNPIFYRVE